MITLPTGLSGLISSARTCCPGRVAISTTCSAAQAAPGNSSAQPTASATDRSASEAQRAAAMPCGHHSIPRRRKRAGTFSRIRAAAGVAAQRPGEHVDLPRHAQRAGWGNRAGARRTLHYATLDPGLPKTDVRGHHIRGSRSGAGSKFRRSLFFPAAASPSPAARRPGGGAELAGAIRLRSFVFRRGLGLPARLDGFTLALLSVSGAFATSVRLRCSSPAASARSRVSRSIAAILAAARPAKMQLPNRAM